MKVAQYRIAGPTAGLRVLRQVVGPQRWRVRFWHVNEKGDMFENEVVVREPVSITSLHAVCMQQLRDLFSDGPLITDGGWEVFRS